MKQKRKHRFTNWKVVGVAISFGGIVVGTSGLFLSPHFDVTAPLGMAAGILAFFGAKRLQRMMDEDEHAI